MTRTRLAAAAAVTALALTGCSSVNTQSDEQTLRYAGGPLQSREFVACLPPSTKQWNIGNLGESFYAYPAGQRTFNFAGGDGSDAEPIKVVASDGIEMTVPGIATFSLNGECDTLRRFHDEVGRKYSAWMDDGKTTQGWRDMLAAYVKQPADRAMDAAAQQFTSRELWNDPNVRGQFERRVAELLPEELRRVAGGGDYFQGLSVTAQKPELPANIAAAIAGRQQAIEENAAQKERNAAALTELDAVKETEKVLGREWAVIYRLGKEGKVDVLPVPQGANVNVQPKR